MEWVTQIEDPGHKSADSDQRRMLYTGLRAGDHTARQLDHFKSTFPADVAALPPDQFGYTEADVLHWALHVPSRPLLVLVGPRGSGKSTLLRYLFRHLPPRVHSLKRFWTVFVDFRSGHPVFQLSNSPRLAEVVGRLSWEIDDYFSRARSDPGSVAPDDDSVSLATMLSNPPFLISQDDSATAASQVAIRLVRRFVDAAAKESAVAILVFDNLDQLNPDAVERTFALAATLSTETNVRVILPQRPWTDNLHAFQLARQGGLITWRIDVPPPDMFAVLRRRFDAAMQQPQLRPTESPGWTARNSLRLEYKSIREPLERLAAFLEHTGFKDSLLSGICEADTRRKIAAFRAFLRWAQLPVEAFLSHEALQRAGVDHDPPERLKKHHMLSGIMCDGRTHFIQSTNPLSSPILNIFCLPSGISGDAYTIMYRLLTLARVHGDFVRKADLFDSLQLLKYRASSIFEAMQTLLRWGLLYSPESDWRLSAVSVLRLAAPGEYYLGALLNDPNYLYEVVLDTPLPHSAWSREHSELLVTTRYESMLELLAGIVALERDELGQLDALSARLRAPLQRSLLCETLLSEIVNRSLEQKLSDGRNGRRAAVRERAAGFVRHDLATLQEHWDRVAQLRRTLPETARDYEELAAITVGHGYRVIVEGPPECPESDDYLTVRLDGTGGNLPFSAERVAAIVEFSAAPKGSQLHRCDVTLRRGDAHVTSRAMTPAISLEGIVGVANWPHGHVWIVEGDRVLGGGALGAHSSS